ncbi:MAG: RDD family protein [Haloarculaceae archaeon]
MEKHPDGDMDRKVGVAKRFAAVFLDGIIVGIPLAVLFSVVMGATMSAGGPRAGFAAAGTLYLLAPVIGFGYFIVMEAVWGYTLGKKILGVVVKNDDGSDIGWAESLIRNILRIVDTLPTLYLIGAIVIWITDDKQRIGDLAASTVVVEQA